MVDEETYIAAFRDYESSPDASAPSWVRELRKTAIDRFATLGFPTTKNEDWRFTRVRQLLQLPTMGSPPSSSGNSVFWTLAAADWCS
jgi:hypothetical protein